LGQFSRAKRTQIVTWLEDDEYSFDGIAGCDRTYSTRSSAQAFPGMPQTEVMIGLQTNRQSNPALLA